MLAVASLNVQMNPQRRIVRMGLAVFMSVLLVAAVVVTVHKDASDSVSELFQPTFTDLRIKLPPLPPLTEEQMKSLPDIREMEYKPATPSELKNVLHQSGVRLHVFKDVSKGDACHCIMPLMHHT